MMPGMGRMNPRQVKQAMRKLGIKTEELEDVSEVVVRTKTTQYIIKDASVTIVEMQGQKTFQIVGEVEVVPLTATPSKTAAVPAPSGPTVPEEDIKLVMDQTGVSRERAMEALLACDGQLAEAILKIMSS